ncbi:MAG: hypothetical protein ACREI2_14765, partial [Nitrospiraceae bacterium]
LVVQGMNGQIAVECDGDRWHGPERYEEDMTRQRMLERCGRKFWRVRGSAFYLDPDGALEDLWTTLAREKVYPEGHEPPKERRPGGFRSESPAARSGESGEAMAGAVPSDDEPPRGLDREPENAQAAADLSRADHPDQQPDHSALSGIRDLADVPYKAWCSEEQLPDPTKDRPSDLIPGLVDIVSTEGPMSAHQLYHIFVKGSGRQRLSRQSRSALKKAVWRAVREGRLDQRNESGQTSVESRILRRAGSPSVVVRLRGNREFVEIPPSEIATVMLRLERKNSTLRGRALCRAVLDFYETKRMTANIEQRIEWIHERRHELAAGDGADHGDPE